MRLFEWNRDFGVFFCTQGVSNIGDAARNVLIPLYVLQLTHDPLRVSAVAFAEVAAFAVLRIPFGALSDRREGRRLMIISDIARTLLTLAIPVTSVVRGPSLTVVYVVVVPVAAASALFDSAADAAVPRLVPANRLSMAYAWRESFESLAWVLGPPIGGLLAVWLGTGQALSVDSASFVVSVIGLVVLRTRFEPQASARDQGLRTSIVSGLRLMRSDRVLRYNQLICSLYVMLGGGIVLGLIFVGTHGGKADALLATVAVAAYAAGSAAGTLIAGLIEEMPNSWLAVACGLGVAAAGAGLVAISAVPAVLAGAAMFGIGEGFVLVNYLTLRASATPASYFGRITGVSGVLGQFASSLSIVWLGLVLRLAPGRTAFVALGAAVLVLAAWVAVAPKPSPTTASPPQPQATAAAK